MLAINRTARVRGRIKRLIDSMSTIRGIKAGGVPRGTKCAIHLEGLLHSEKITGPNHRPIDIVNPTVIKAEVVRV